MNDLLDAWAYYKRHVQEPPSAPDQRAMALLLRHLTPEQQRQLLEHNYFDMRVQLPANGFWRFIPPIAFGDHIVRLHNVRHGFVELLNSRMVWCIYIAEKVPPADETLAKKLLLEANVKDFLAVGNAMPLAVPEGYAFFVPGYKAW
jgi:hypothetical protein